MEGAWARHYVHDIWLNYVSGDSFYMFLVG